MLTVSEVKAQHSTFTFLYTKLKLVLAGHPFVHMDIIISLYWFIVEQKTANPENHATEFGGTLM